MQAIWNNQVIAEADKSDLVYIEGRWYFPPESVKKEFLRQSDTPYNCPWKGDCQYFDVVQDEHRAHDNSWSYPVPLQSAINIVGKDFGNYLAFWREVEIKE